MPPQIPWHSAGLCGLCHVEAVTGREQYVVLHVPFQPGHWWAILTKLTTVTAGSTAEQSATCSEAKKITYLSRETWLVRSPRLCHSLTRPQCAGACVVWADACEPPNSRSTHTWTLPCAWGDGTVNSWHMGKWVCLVGGRGESRWSQWVSMGRWTQTSHNRQRHWQWLHHLTTNIKLQHSGITPIVDSQ